MQNDNWTIRTHWFDFYIKLVYWTCGYVLTSLICFYFRESLFWTLNAAFLQEESAFIFTRITEAFWGYLKLSVIVSIYLNVPLATYFSWLFLAKSLYNYQNLIKVTYLLLLAQFTTIIGYLFMNKLGPTLLAFFLEFSRKASKPYNLILMPRFAEYLNLIYKIAGATLILISLVAILALLATKFRKTLRQFSYCSLFIVFSVMAPPEPILQLIIFVFLVFIYELLFYWFSFFKQIQKILDGGGIRTHDET